MRMIFVIKMNAKESKIIRENPKVVQNIQTESSLSRTAAAVKVTLRREI